MINKIVLLSLDINLFYKKKNILVAKLYLCNNNYFISITSHY